MSNEENKWKVEQIKYFKEYLSMFRNDTREYYLIKKGIEQLERSL